jgi:hypothetical protein
MPVHYSPVIGHFALFILPGIQPRLDGLEQRFMLRQRERRFRIETWPSVQAALSGELGLDAVDRMLRRKSQSKTPTYFEAFGRINGVGV